MKTPEQIARENLDVDCYDSTDEPIIETIDDLVSLVTQAIEADRKQHEKEYTCFKNSGELD